MKKFLYFSIFIFLISCFFICSQKNTYAQIIGPWYDQSFPQWFVKVYEDSNPQEIFGERYTAAQVQWIFYSLVQLIPLPKRIIACAMTADFSGCFNELGRIFFPISNATPLNERSIAERINSAAEVLAFATFQDRPISGIGQIKNSIAKLATTDVYAQEAQGREGTGFRALSAVRSLWSATRNVTYLLMVLVIIIFSFLIMFRMKVSPQAVITVQSSLWTIFVTLILITFSYAIAGFAIDLMYVVTALISVMFTQAGIFIADNRPALTIYQVLTEGPGSLGLLGFFVGYLSTFSTVLFYIIQSPEASITSIISNLVGPLIAGPLSTIVSLILGISLIFIFLKLLWVLIKTFVNILMLVIISPFQILFGSIGGTLNGFKEWLTKLFQNLAVYPTVGVLFLMSYIFLSGAFFVDAEFVGSFNQAINNLIGQRGFMISNFGFGVNRELFISGVNANWSPPFTFGGQNLSLLWLFASYACIAMTPRVVELVQSFFSGKQFPYETAIGQSTLVAGAMAAGNWAGREVGNIARGQLSTAIGTTASYLQQRSQAYRSRSTSQTTGGSPNTPRPNASQTAQANQVNYGSTSQTTGGSPNTPRPNASQKS